MAEAQTTTDHDVIRRWAEERKAHPATVSGTGTAGPGVLRLDFEESDPAERLEPISWEQFFDKFDQERLAFLYQEETSDGETSRFAKFIERGS